MISLLVSLLKSLFSKMISSRKSRVVLNVTIGGMSKVSCICEWSASAAYSLAIFRVVAMLSFLKSFSFNLLRLCWLSFFWMLVTTFTVLSSGRSICSLGLLLICSNIFSFSVVSASFCLLWISECRRFMPRLANILSTCKFKDSFFMLLFSMF